MLLKIHPKLPMRNKEITKSFYISKLGFKDIGAHDYKGYLMLQKDDIQIHFFEYEALNPLENYGQVYIRTNDIEHIYQTFLSANVEIHPNGRLTKKPWGQHEFSLLDTDNNLLTFGQDL